MILEAWALVFHLQLRDPIRLGLREAQLAVNQGGGLHPADQQGLYLPSVKTQEGAWS